MEINMGRPHRQLLLTLVLVACFTAGPARLTAAEPVREPVGWSPRAVWPVAGCGPRPRPGPSGRGRGSTLRWFRTRYRRSRVSVGQGGNRPDAGRRLGD